MTTIRYNILILTATAAALLLGGCNCNYTAESNTQLEKDLAMYVDVWNQIINESRIDLINEEHFTSDITLVMSPENVVGIEAFKEYYNQFLVGFSDLEFIVEEAFGEGDRIVKHWTFKGTHTGEFFGIPATGKAVELEGVTLVRMRDGKIAVEQDFFDNLTFMQQLGIIPKE